MDFDIVIIGGGPAGLTAGLYSARANLKTILIEKAVPGGQLTTTYMIENYPGFEEVTGFELSQKMENHARKFGLEIINGHVVGIETERKNHKIIMDDRTIFAKTVILATGASPKKIGIPGEDEFRGKGVSYCATCDGPFFNGKRVAVIGGGNSALEEGLFLTRFAKEVILIHRRDRFRATKIFQERVKKNQKIKTILNHEPLEIHGKETVESIVLRNRITDEKVTIDVDGVFVFIGYTPNTAFLKGLLKTDDRGYIITDEKMATSLNGVFAAGDVRANPLKQIATAVGEGAIAAHFAEQYISSTRKA